MKAALSIPDKLDEKSDRLALGLKPPRNRPQAYKTQHDGDAITAAANALADDEAYQAEAEIITRAGARTVLEHSDW